jgi:hypothetical protein
MWAFPVAISTRAPAIFQQQPTAEDGTDWFKTEGRSAPNTSSRCPRFLRDLPMRLGAALLDLAGKDRGHTVSTERAITQLISIPRACRGSAGIPKREREPDMPYDGKPDHLG